MNNIEIIVCLVLLFMAVPDWCRKLGRPALVFPAFVVFGFLLRPLVNPEVRTMLEQAGQVGFLLLLFEVGLEIELPPLQAFIRPLRHAASWAFLQYPIAFGLATVAGLEWLPAFVAAGFCGCGRADGLLGRHGTSGLEKLSGFCRRTQAIPLARHGGPRSHGHCCSGG